MLKPLAKDRWNYPAAAHLLARAGFGGPPAEIEKLAALSPEQAVSRLLDYEATPDPLPPPEWARPDPERAERARRARMAAPEERRRIQREEQQAQRRHLVELRGWWLQRMTAGARPLQEKMVLFWHGHFATSVEKVRDAYLMWRQNELFRRLATGNWLKLLVEAGKDPAMLIWLDQAQSRKQHPNENFARELMELFALGEGHYTEKDVTEAARALTGWSYDRLSQKFVERPFLHDNGEKLIYGRRDNFDGESLMEWIVAQPQAARFITSKLWKFFAGSEPSERLATELAGRLRASGNEFKPVLRSIFLSEEFYSAEVMGNQVKSPVEWLVGSVRLLERPLPPALVCMGLTRSLGQDLFAPPNVKGWDGGVTWINTNTLLLRYNEAATLVKGDLSNLGGLARKTAANPALTRRIQNVRIAAVDVDKLFSSEERASAERVLEALKKRFLLAQLKPRQEEILKAFLHAQTELTDETLLDAVRLAMSTPEYQLT